jgi:putative transposase
MTNHIHFLVTPQNEESVSDAMKVVGSRYAQYINLKYKRTGTLWEGRHRSSLVQTDTYLLTCYRYIELNPVRA